MSMDFSDASTGVAPVLGPPVLPPLGPDQAQFSSALLTAMLALRDGNFSARMPADLTGLNGKLADAFNDIVVVSDRRVRETARITLAVGKRGQLKQRMHVSGVAGAWAEEVGAINTLIDDLVWPTTEVTRAVGAVAKVCLAARHRPGHRRRLPAARLRPLPTGRSVRDARHLGARHRTLHCQAPGRTARRLDRRGERRSRQGRHLRAAVAQVGASG